MTDLPSEAGVPAPRGGPAPRGRRPGPAVVIWGSIALFAVLFAVLTYQLEKSSGTAPRPVLVRKVIKRQVVTTIVPTPGQSTVTSGPVVSSQLPSEPAPLTTSAS